MSGEEDTKRKKRIVIICTSSFLLVAMVVAVTVGVNNSDGVNGQSRISSTQKAVKTFCSPTSFKKDCEENLLAEVGSTTDSKELMKLAFNITVAKIRKGIEKTGLLEDVEKEPRAKMALDTCKKLMDLSIGELQRSIEGITSFNINNLESILVSLRVWLTGAMTYQETCLDGFANITSEAGTKMKHILRLSKRMSSNALDVVTDLENAVKDINVTKDERRLFEDYKSSYVGEQVGHDDVNEVPSWVGDGSSAGVRRLLQVAQNKLKANVVVAQDGSGKFRTINEALKLVPVNGQKPFVIYIKQGVYREYVDITILMTNVVLVGDGDTKTIISGNKNMADGIATYATPTLAVGADYFVAMSIGIENTAGLLKQQACALRVQGDKAIFYQCSIHGYQDTLYAHTMRQFYRDCTVSGTIDFVFGNAQAVFQNCTFIVRKPLDMQQCIIVAQSRTEENQPSGIVIQGSRIVSDPPDAPATYKAYLGRPWKNFARTIVMDTYIGEVIQPEGFMPWEEPDKRLTGMDTCYYAEVNNTGPGSDKSKRVKWPGIKNLTPESAHAFDPGLFFQGDDWIKNTKIPYSSGSMAAPKPKQPTPQKSTPQKAQPPTPQQTTPQKTQPPTQQQTTPQKTQPPTQQQPFFPNPKF
ncbi:pectinesterase-like [Vicia villosa]|uniref:pectinesterase-like n=1 Tax=Vicia villosa TaxID=3911 RepID=UPI00273C3161|nr:pectinesterase-like [Vicia villosa]